MDAPEEIRNKYNSLRVSYFKKGLPNRDLETIGLTISDAQSVGDYKSALIQIVNLANKVKKHPDIEVKVLGLYKAIVTDLGKKGINSYDDPRYLENSYIKDRLRELKIPKTIRVLDKKLKSQSEPTPEHQPIITPKYQEPEAQQEPETEQPQESEQQETLEETVEPTLQPQNQNNHPMDSLASSSEQL